MFLEMLQPIIGTATSDPLPVNPVNPPNPLNPFLQHVRIAFEVVALVHLGGHARLDAGATHDGHRAASGIASVIE